MMKKLAVLALLNDMTMSAAVNYAKLGDDWPDDSSISDNKCGGDYQSPINLISSVETVSYQDDKFFKHYEDLESNAVFTYKTKWLGDKFTAQVDFAPPVSEDVSTWK